MMQSAIKRVLWPVAISMSVIAHISIASVFVTSEEDAKIAGGTEVSISVLGSSDVDAVMVGELQSKPTTHTLKPDASRELKTETEKSELTPRDQSDEISTLEPVNEISESTPQNSIIEDRHTDEILSITSSQDIQSSDPAAIPNSTETFELAALPASSNLVNSVPVPQLRLEIPKELLGKTVVIKKTKKKETPTKKKTTKKKKREKNVPKTISGNNGKAQENRKRGKVDATKKKGSSASKGTAKSRQAGNASISNYKGKLRRKITRRFKPGRSKPGKRDAVVSFVIIANGQAKSIRLARSSGNKKLDLAAVKAVQRSSPFPPLPEGKSKLSISVPLNTRR